MDVRKLKAAMVARGVGVDELARETGLSRALVYRRLAKPDDCSIGEVRRVSEALALSAAEAAEIFFSASVA